ncbi:MAG: hypothetical protein IJ220_06095 [Clostridia bacterium]|nr:hypothetical protein [Clostridia bacterium]
MKKVLKCAMIIVGTLIGAGFASGQEIVSFFNRFSTKGILGIVLSSILFGIITFLSIAISDKINEYDYKKIIKNNKIFTWFIKAFTFICFCIMLSCIGTYIQEQCGLNYWIGTILAGVICFVSFLFRFNGLEKINSYLVPIILLGIAILYFYSGRGLENVEIEYKSVNHFLILKNWFHASILYVGYNSILLIPIIIEIKRYQLNKSEKYVLSALIFFIFCITGLLIFFTMNKYYPQIAYVEMPTIFIAKSIGPILFSYYSFVMIFAIFTTAYSSGYAFLKLNSEKNYLRNCVMICISGIIFARMGFSNLINVFFPIFGYFGILQMIYILVTNL